jgi:hypothetical protein
MIPTTGFAFVTGEPAWYAIPQVALFLYSVALIALRVQLLHVSRASALPSTGGRQLQGADAMSDDHRGNKLPLAHPCAGG